jgi:hypothetical protein
MFFYSAIPGRIGRGSVANGKDGNMRRLADKKINGHGQDQAQIDHLLSGNL